MLLILVKPFGSISWYIMYLDTTQNIPKPQPHTAPQPLAWCFHHLSAGIPARQQLGREAGANWSSKTFPMANL